MNNPPNKLLLSGSSLKDKTNKRTSVTKIEESAEPIGNSMDQLSSSVIHSESSKYLSAVSGENSSSDDKRQLKRTSNELLKAKNYLKTQLKLQEPQEIAISGIVTMAEGVESNCNSNATTRLRSSSFLMGKNSSDFSHLLVNSYDASSVSSETAANNHITANKPQTARSSFVSNTAASLARNVVSKKASNENIRSVISKISRQKSGDQFKSMLPMNEKLSNRGICCVLFIVSSLRCFRNFNFYFVWGVAV